MADADYEPMGDHGVHPVTSLIFRTIKQELTEAIERDSDD